MRALMSHGSRRRSEAAGYKRVRARRSKSEPVQEARNYIGVIRPRRTLQYKGSRVPMGKRRPTRPEYAQYLRSEHWLHFRDRYHAEALLHECFVCGAPEYELHHLTYERLWAEKLTDVMPLCGLCHGRVHNVVKRAKLTLARAPIYLKHRTPKQRESYD